MKVKKVPLGGTNVVQRMDKLLFKSYIELRDSGKTVIGLPDVVNFISIHLVCPLPKFCLTPWFRFLLENFESLQ